MLSQSNLVHLTLTLHSDFLHLLEKVVVAQDAHKPVICKIQGTPHTQFQNPNNILSVSTLLNVYIICINCPEMYCLLPSSTINQSGPLREKKESESNKEGERRYLR